MYLIAMILLLKTLFNSAFMLGLFQFLALIPGALLSPVVGIVVDSHPRRAILVASDIVRAAVMLLAGAVLLGVDFDNIVGSERLPIAFGVLFAAFLLGIGNAFFVPAAQALIPSLVPRERLQSANGLRAASNQSFNLAGNAAGGALYALLGPALLFLVNGATFLLSGIGELWIREPAPPEGDTVPASADNDVFTSTENTWSGRLRAGFEALRRDRSLARLFFSQFGLFVFSPTLLLALPFLVIDELGYGEAVLGLVFAASLTGGIAVFLLGRGTESEQMLRRNWPAMAYGVMGAAFLLLAVLPLLPLVIIAAFLLGGAAAAVYIFVTTAIQIRVSAETHGRMFALLEAGSAVIAPLAYVAGGSVLDLLGPARRHYLFLGWAILTVLWAVYLTMAHRRDRIQDGVQGR